MLDLYIAIDGHAAYPQSLRVAQRHALDLYILTRDYLLGDINVHLIVGQEDDAKSSAWILGNIVHGDICVTANSGLAVSCILRGALALTPAGSQWGVDPMSDGTKVSSKLWPRDIHAFADALEKAIASIKAARRPAFTPLPDFARRSFAGPLRPAPMTRAAG